MQHLIMNDVAMVRVPNLPELSAINIFRIAMMKIRFREYLPDVDIEKALNR